MYIYLSSSSQSGNGDILRCVRVFFSLFFCGGKKEQKKRIFGRRRKKKMPKKKTYTLKTLNIREAKRKKKLVGV
jgi:hypothetical protein